MLKRLFKNVLCFIICPVLVSGIICLISLKGSNKTGLAEDTGYSIKLKDNGSKADSEKIQCSSSGNKSTDADEKCLGIYNKNQKCLILANRDNPLPKDYSLSLRYICNGRLQASEYLYDSLVKMLADAEKKGYSYWIASAYRSYEK